ncbi:pentapeptide repeat-containing protein [Streptomyces pseudovenezuelae]|uniref:pentapeptide repeat-containing protein n=1 Tax=Streptomyces pseudovenezuelae TaxID=67350 RepID=UPI0036E85E04
MKRRVLGWSCAALGGLLFVMLLWKGPWWVDGAHLGPSLTPGSGAVVTGFRTAVVAIGAGVFAGFGVFYTDRNFRHTRELFEHTREKDREQATLTREGQMTDRYATAIGLLSAAELTKRLGGIYALERIMRDSPKDHATVVEVLAAFIREHAPAPPRDDPPSQSGDQHQPSEHVQAALTVLSRRPDQHEQFRVNLRRTDLRGAYLEQAHLRRADLTEARLEGANLFEAQLGEAILSGANLREADLRKAELEKAGMLKSVLAGAQLKSANLRDATMEKAQMQGAKLRSADLEDAFLGDANLTDSDLSYAKLARTDLVEANLEGATLRGATLAASASLTVEQILSVRNLTRAELPERLLKDPRVQARLRQVSEGPI